MQAHNYKSILRFVANGLFATMVNYAALVTLLEYVGMRSTGVAAMISALVGIAASFTGNRLFVFRSAEPLLPELLRFKVLYVSVAVFQALFLGAWSDYWGLNYSIGFLLVNFISLVLSYLGNRIFVFR